MNDVLRDHHGMEPAKRQKIYGMLAGAFLQVPTIESLSQQKEVLGFLLRDRIEWDVLMSDVGAVEQAFYDSFFVPTSGHYVPPYESALLSYVESGKRFGKLNGPSATHIAHCWKETGFSIDSFPVYEPLRQSYMPDHVGLQLAFMAFLCGAEASGGEQVTSRKWRRYRQGFLEDHLHKAVNAFVEAMEEIAQGYYAVLASFAAAWVEADLTMLVAENKEG